MPLQKVLITGANGHLAPFVIDRLRSAYHLTLTSRSRPHKAYDGIPFIQGDMTHFHDVARCCEGQDAVIHLASVLTNRLELPVEAFADAMVKGAWHVAEACVQHGVRRVVHISSILACGQPDDTTRPYHLGDPSSFLARDLFYPLAKHLAEQILDAYHDAHGLAVIHLRPGVIAGDPRYPPPARPDPLEAKRCWFRHVDPRDVAQAVELALTSERNHGCYHLIAGRTDSMFDWSTARQELGFQPKYNWPDIPDNI